MKWVNEFHARMDRWGAVSYTHLDVYKRQLLHGGGGTLKLLDALVVVVDKDACDVPVAPLNEQADEPVGALRVVDNDPGAAEIFVVVVVEDDRDMPCLLYTSWCHRRWG